MKTFKQFLEDVSYSTGGGPGLLEWLKQQSPEATNAYIMEGHALVRGQGGKMGDAVYRGSNDDYIFTVYRVTANKARSPVDTPKKVAGYIDDWFDENGYGRPRSQGVFTAIGDDAGPAAESYGQGSVYAIFPLGNAQYVWSAEVYDLYETLNEMTYEVEVDDISELTRENINAMMSRIQWNKSNSPQEAIQDGNAIGTAMEVVVQCDEFLCLRVESRLTGIVIHPNQIMNAITQGE